MPQFIFTIDTDITGDYPVTSTDFVGFNVTNTLTDGTYEVVVTWTSFSRTADSSGLSFAGKSYKANASINITQFAGIPLNKSGYQFENFAGTITATDSPYIDENASFMFFQSTSNPDVTHFNMSTATSMSGMFLLANFNQDIGGWNVSNVTDMSGLFNDNTAFNQDIGSWNVSNVTNMLSMFNGSTVFNQNISGWDVSNVTNMGSMFSRTSYNQNIGGWNVSKVENMSSMFFNNTAFNQDIDSWNVSNVTSFSGMFSGAILFNQDISSWNVSNVTDMSLMFNGARSFNQNISGWTTTSLQNIMMMFTYATSFRQNIGGWNLSSLTSAPFPLNVFNFSNLDCNTYSEMLVSMQASNTVPDNLNFGTITTRRIDNTATNNAWTYLTGKSVTFTDNGTISVEDAAIITDNTLTEYTLTNNDAVTLSQSDQYTLITDDGGIASTQLGTTGNIDKTISFTDGVSLTVHNDMYYVADVGNYVLNIYDQDSNLVYDSAAVGSRSGTSTVIDISTFTSLRFVGSYTSGRTFEYPSGFVAVLAIVDPLGINVCFKSDTIIYTDTGPVEIKYLTTNHTIKSQQIKYVTKTVSNDKHLIKISKDSLAIGLPNKDLTLTKDHKVMFRGQLIEAEFLLFFDGVHKVENTHELLYNVLLPEYTVMVCNGLLCETLHPSNQIVKIYDFANNMTNKQKSECFSVVNKKLNKSRDEHYKHNALVKSKIDKMKWKAF